jgi:type I restriction enzyme S subunit
VKAGWPVGTLVSVSTKFTDGDWIESKDQSETGIRLVQTGNVGIGEFKDRRDKARLKCFEVLPDDCLISRLPDPVGRGCLIPETGDKMITAVDCSVVRIDQTQMLPAFYLYYLQSSAYFALVEADCSGTTRKRISRKKLEAIPIPIPPIEEQKRIVAVLDVAFEGLTRAKEKAETNLQNARELFESTLSFVFDQSDEWRATALNDHVAFMDYRGKTPPKREAGVRLITAKNVKRGFVQVEPMEFIDAEAYDGWMTRGFPEEGDVLFTTEAPLANVAQLDTTEKVVIGQRLITMKPDRALIDREFLKFALMSPQMQEEIFSYATGATVLGIKAKLLKTVSFRFPKSLDEQRKVAGLCRTSFEKMDELAEIYRTKLTDISDLRQSLLQKAFAGELT